MGTQLKQYDIIAVPDVHGRTFWKDAIPFIENGTNVVFLGDYLDPYSHEGITPKEALGNFKEILGITKDKPNVTMLIGNHDFEYIIDDAPACRCDYDNFEEIHDLFWENADMFHFGKRFRSDMATPPLTFSHAGIHPLWYLELKLTLTELDKTDVDSILFAHSLRDINDEGKLDLMSRFLNRVSTMRGGNNQRGSMIWADIHEFNPQETLDMFGLQVVGHTMQVRKEYTDKEHGHYKWVPGEPVRLASSIICIDCQHCYGIVHDPETSFYNLEEIKSH